jgi:hypothetical protein
MKYDYEVPQPGDWLQSRREGLTGLALGLDWPRNQPIDFKSMFLSKPKPIYRIHVTETDQPARWDPHSVLSNWKVIRAKNPGRKNPPWVAAGVELYDEDGLPLTIYDVRGSWVMVVGSLEDPCRLYPWNDFVGIYKVKDLPFRPKLNRLERAAFLT